MFTYVVSCAAGFEKLVEGELTLMGVNKVARETGVIHFQGTIEQGYRCCLWSRFGSRVFLVLDTFAIDNTDMLYEKCCEFPWQEHLDKEKCFAINCTLSEEASISHSHYAAMRVKDALVDSFRVRFGSRPNVQTHHPDVQFHLHVKGNTAQLLLDFSGESLHRRGYRAGSGNAPLKETLGAALVALSGWPEAPGPLIDPMCGTGTLLIEAALMFSDSAPGLSRNYFGFQGWQEHQENIWQDLVAEAVDREERGLMKQWPPLIGYDCDPVAVSSAKKNISKAGLEEYIDVKQKEVAFLQPCAAAGMVLSNLPFGERLLEKETVGKLYNGLGRILRQRFIGWNCALFIANPEMTDNFGLTWQHKHKLYNGSIRCSLLVGEVDQTRKPFQWILPDPDPDQLPQNIEFANRLKKNLTKIMKWADRESVDCFRVYDRDLPDYNFTVDIYGKWLHVQEYAPPKTVDPALANSRMEMGLKTIRQITGARSDRVFVKRRERQRGRKQYEKKNDKKKFYEVTEGGASLLVNFTDYLDTGLFLDHRPLRQRIAVEAKGRRFLNLFGYTGAATVHAALGGAQQTTTVDLSATYVKWATLNLALNGFSELHHRVAKADCLEWLRDCGQMFDLIFVDPPTFSNTKKEGRIFDIQKDHGGLLEAAMSRLEKGGSLYFSTNFSRFQFDSKLFSSYKVSNISKKTIPFDFARNPRVHYCWQLEHHNV